MNDQDDRDKWDGFLSDMERGMEEIRQAEMTEEHFRKERAKFIKEIHVEISDIVFDYYPEKQNQSQQMTEQFQEQAIFLFDRVSHLLRHYLLEGRESFQGIIIPVRMELLESVWEMKHAWHGLPEQYQEEHYNRDVMNYIDLFRYYSSLNTAHKSVKKILLKYYPKIVELPVNGFIELDNKLFFSTKEMIAHKLHPS